MAMPCPLNQNIGLLGIDGSLDMILKRGTNLPALGQITLHADQPPHKCNDSKPLRIPLYEGAHIKCGDHSRQLIDILVHGRDIDQDIPSGTEVELELLRDRNRTLRATVRFPAIDGLSVPGDVRLVDATQSRLALRALLDRQLGRFEVLYDDAETANSAVAHRVLTVIRKQEFPRRIDAMLEDETNLDIRHHAERLIRDFAVELDKL